MSSSSAILGLLDANETKEEKVYPWLTQTDPCITEFLKNCHLAPLKDRQYLPPGKKTAETEDWIRKGQKFCSSIRFPYSIHETRYESETPSRESKLQNAAT